MLAWNGRCVLVVVHQIELRARIARVLQSAGYAVELADNQKRAIELAASKQIEAAIVVHSSDLNGLEKALCDHVPRTIVLGHRTDEILRPGHSLFVGQMHFLWKHWMSRSFSISSDHRRHRQGAQARQLRSAPVILKIEDCQLDLAAHTFVDGNGREVQLTRAEIALLAAFVGSPRRVLSRDQLCRAAVGRGAGHYDRNIDMLVARLRRKIEPNPKAPQFILSVPGVGYKFAVQPQTGENIDALPATDLEISNQSGLREAKPVTARSRHYLAPFRARKAAGDCFVLRARWPGGACSNPNPEVLVGIVQDVFKKFAPPLSRIGAEWLSRIWWVMKFLRCLDIPRATRTMLNARCMQASILWQMSASFHRRLARHCKRGSVSRPD